MIFGEILGPDLLIVIGILALLFGGGQIPKLAKSLGQAKREFEKGLSDSDDKPTQSAATDVNVLTNDSPPEPKP